MVWGLWVIAIVLGLRHAVAPDHMTAVTTLVKKNNCRPLEGMLAALRVGGGHAFGMIGMGGLVVLVFHRVPEGIVQILSQLAGWWLVVMALVIFWDLWLPRSSPSRFVKNHLPRWVGTKASAWGIGLILGLAIAPADLAIFLMMSAQAHDPMFAMSLLGVFLVAMLGALGALGWGIGWTYTGESPTLHRVTTGGAGVLGLSVGMLLVTGILH